MTRTPAVVFDLDGTIVDSAFGIAAALNATGLARQPVSIETVRSLVSSGAERLIGETLSLPSPQIEGALAAFRDLYALDPCTEGDLYPGVHATLQVLKDAGVALGVCTNKPQRLAEIVIDRLGLAVLLPVVIGSAPDRPSKPHPDSLLEAIKRLAGGQSVLVGDSMVDAETAKAAAIPFVHVTFGYGAIDTGFDCARHVDTFAALPSVLEPLLHGDRAHAR